MVSERKSIKANCRYDTRRYSEVRKGTGSYLLNQIDVLTDGLKYFIIEYHGAL